MLSIRDRVRLKRDYRGSNDPTRLSASVTVPKGATGTVAATGTEGGVLTHLEVRLDFSVYGLEHTRNKILLRTAAQVGSFIEEV